MTIVFQHEIASWRHITNFHILINIRYIKGHSECVKVSNFVIARSGWKSPASVWTVRSGNLAAAQTISSYNIWTDLAVSQSAGRKEANCRVRSGQASQEH